MKTRLYLILGSISVASICSFILTGKLIQQSYYDTLASINTQSDIKVSLLKYKRGIFRSSAELQVANKGNNFSINQVITHGPLIAAKSPSGVNMRFLAAQLQSTVRVAWQSEPISVTTFVDFKDQAKSWFKLEDINQTTENNFNVSWNTINGEITHDLGFKTYQASINIPNVVVASPEWRMNLNGCAVSVEQNQQDLIRNTAVTFNTKSLNVHKGENIVIELNDINTDLQLKNENDLYSINFAANLDNSQILQQKFAQDSILFKANKVNKLALQEFSKSSMSNPGSMLILARQMTANSTELDFQVPKYFSEALLSLFGMEIYKASPLSQLDKRADAEILNDVSTNVNKLVQNALQQQLFIDNGTHYALNTTTH